tara:strand:+ start:207 stop:821 length:615 start_codon:yes stop_codon:yes gene_type:complete
MNDIFDDMEADSNKESLFSKHNLTNEDLSTLTGMADAIIRQDEYTKKVEGELKEAKKKLLKMTDEDLPTMMTEANTIKFVMEDGSEVSIKPQYGASIRVDNRPTAYQWLRDNGFGYLIKNQIIVSFGVDEDEIATEFMNFIEGHLKVKYQKENLVSQVEKIEPMSLRTWVKERNENGEEFPMELFGAYIGQRAVIKKGVKNGGK